MKTKIERVAEYVAAQEVAVVARIEVVTRLGKEVMTSAAFRGSVPRKLANECLVARQRVVAQVGELRKARAALRRLRRKEGIMV